MAAPLKVTIELAALDNGSKVLNVAFDKIASKAGATAAKISKSAFDVSKKAAVIGGLIAAPLAYGTKQAVEFQDAMAGVAKVTNAAVGVGKGFEKFEKLSTDAKAAAVEIGIAADASAGLMASLASGGVVEKDLAGMTVTAGKVGVAFDLAAEVAGESFVKMRNALGITNDEARKAADSFNYLSDNSASKAAQILTYMANGGASVARTLGIAAPQAAAFGATLVSMGKGAEESATIMLRFQKALYLKGNEDMLGTYKKAGAGASGLMAVLKQGAGIKNPDAQFKYFARMGEYGTSVSLLAKSYGQLQNNMNLVSKEANYAGSVDAEFKNRNSTVKGQLNLLKSQAGVLAIDLGTVLLPAITDITREVMPLVKELATWIKANPQLTAQLIRGAGAMSVASFGVSGLASTIGGAAKAVDMLGPSFSRAGRLTTSFAAGLQNRAFEGTFKIFEKSPKIGQALFNLGGKVSTFGGTLARVFSGGWLVSAIQGVGAAIAGITLPIAIGIAAVAAAAYVVYRNWDKLRPMFVNTWRTIRNVSVGIYDTVAFYMGKAADWIYQKFSIVRTVVDYVKNAFSTMKMPAWLSAAGNWVGAKLSGAADVSASFANDAAARRGLSRNLTGAVTARPALRAGQAAARRAAPLPAPTAPGGGGAVVNYSPIIHMPAGTTAAQKEDFKKLLQQHSGEVNRIVEEKTRRKAAASY